MKQENGSARIPPEKSSDPNPSEGQRVLTPAAGTESGDVEIDFHSAEFNRVDDLNDCAGNYRSFQSLDGVITAHERHQIDLRRRRDDFDPSRDEPVSQGKTEIETDDIEALEEAASLTVVSEGRTLIIDTDAERAMACVKTLRDHRLPCALIVTGNALPRSSPSRPGRMKYLVADRVSVSGAFGGFSAKVTVGEIEKPLAEYFDDGAIFDMVLDLQPVPSFAGGRLPIGYYAPGPSPAALAETMAELPEMRGQFKKPKFVVLNKSRCFHGRSRVHDCRRCVEICPINAIQSKNREIIFNHYPCQGCGACALICPADAIRVVQPTQEELLNSLWGTLESRWANGISPMSLVISDAPSAASNGSPGPDERDCSLRIRYDVEQIARIRLEVLLTAVVYGAREVLVECGLQNPPAIREAVEGQVQMARAILRGLGMEEERIRFLVLPPADGDSTKADPHPVRFAEQASNASAPATFRSGRDRRALVYWAAQVLHDQSGMKKPWLPLPAGSSFGAVTLNSDACTLCMACAGTCPSGALSSGGKTPRLVFRELQCHQCGLCRETCPEDAIQLVPRLLLDPGAAENQTVLRETEPFRCVECGVPFAPPAMIDRIKEKLAGHWMYANERQLRRLQMCPTCRTRDALTSPEMAPWNR